jgi:hypothetical protein
MPDEPTLLHALNRSGRTAAMLLTARVVEQREVAELKDN